MTGRWLLKTEPDKWSWDHQEANGGISNWDGVRNAQAQKYLRAMEVGDLCFFYHSVTGKEIVGVARVCKAFYPDASDASGKHGMVDIEAVSRFPQPVSLARLKQQTELKDFILFRQFRLSVIPVTETEWDIISRLASESDIQANETRSKETTNAGCNRGKAQRKRKSNVLAEAVNSKEENTMEISNSKLETRATTRRRKK